MQLLVLQSSADVELLQRQAFVVLCPLGDHPDDLHGMVVAEGIPTSHGTSHAAVIARGMGAPCVCGADTLRIDAAIKRFTAADLALLLTRAMLLPSTAFTGDVILGAVERFSQSFWVTFRLSCMADEVRLDESRGRVIGARANADNPAAQTSVDNGAEAIGLDRTEHMFLVSVSTSFRTSFFADSEDVSLY